MLCWGGLLGWQEWWHFMGSWFNGSWPGAKLIYWELIYRELISWELISWEDTFQIDLRVHCECHVPFWSDMALWCTNCHCVRGVDLVGLTHLKYAERYKNCTSTRLPLPTAFLSHMAFHSDQGTSPDGPLISFCSKLTPTVGHWVQGSQLSRIALVRHTHYSRIASFSHALWT